MVQISNSDGRAGFALRLNEAIAAAGWQSWGAAARLARELSPRVSERAAGKWLSGDAIPDTKRLDSICAVLGGISPDWLLTGRGSMHRVTPSYGIGAPIAGTDVPVIDFSTLADASIGEDFQPAKMAVDWKSCPVSTHGPRTFAFRVTDNSNTAAVGLRSYPVGCYLYVDPDRKDVKHDKGVLARIPSGDLVVAIYKLQVGHPPRLGYLNPGYRDYDGPFEIVGMVIGKWEEE